MCTALQNIFIECDDKKGFDRNRDKWEPNLNQHIAEIGQQTLSRDIQVYLLTLKVEFYSIVVVICLNGWAAQIPTSLCFGKIFSAKGTSFLSSLSRSVFTKPHKIWRFRAKLL